MGFWMGVPDGMKKAQFRQMAAERCSADGSVCEKTTRTVPLRERAQAIMVLSAVGDAVGYRNSQWEFQKSTQIIMGEWEAITKGRGMPGLTVDLAWRASDDTIMHIATAKALVKASRQKKDFWGDVARISQELAVQYKECWKHMHLRSPGKRTGKSIQLLNVDGSNWNKVPFNRLAGGCGAAMRAACIGLRFWKPEDLPSLIAVTVESGRLTHHLPIAYLGALAAAYFTSLALQDVPPPQWGLRLLQLLPKVREYLQNAEQHNERELKLNLAAFSAFSQPWEEYLKLRALSSPNCTKAKFPDVYGATERDHWAKGVSYRGWPGASGYDAPMIAYDALLGALQADERNLHASSRKMKGAARVWNEVCVRGVLHGGDNDSTGTIALAWYGALFGFAGVPECNQRVEFGQLARQLGRKLLKLSDK